MKTISKKEIYLKAIKINERVKSISVIEKKYPEIYPICKVIRERAENKISITVKEFCDSLIVNRLSKIVVNLPDEGYSMGSLVEVFVGKGKYQLSVKDNRRKSYSNQCKYSPTWGYVYLYLTYSELKNIQVIANLVTYIYPNQKTKIKKCYWYAGKGAKQYFSLEKTEGYVYAGYHSPTKKGAQEGGEKNIQYQKEKLNNIKKRSKGLRLQYSFDDSINAGNCEPGTKAFIIRLNLNINKKYRGSYLLKLATEKSLNSVYYVNKMIDYKINNL